MKRVHDIASFALPNLCFEANAPLPTKRHWPRLFYFLTVNSRPLIGILKLIRRKRHFDFGNGFGDFNFSGTGIGTVEDSAAAPDAHRVSGNV